MSGKNLGREIFFDFFLFLFLPPLFIFKLIGEIFLSFGRLFPKTYSFLKRKLTLGKKISRKTSPKTSFSSLNFFLFKIKYFFLGVIFSLLVFFLYQASLLAQSLDKTRFLQGREQTVTSKIFDRKGRLLYEIYAEENRTPVALSQIPSFLKEATLAIEDKDFFRHQGFSLRGILRAFLRNLSSERKEGGSTITQQLIRSVLLTPEKSLRRKVKELFLAVLAEQIYTKEEILEMYLNQVPYGGTAWGVEAAAEKYFGKKVEELTLAEAALLAGLPAAPTFYSPFGAHPEMAKKRQAEVLRRMVEDGYLTQEEKEKALKEELRFQPQKIAISAPHFVMYVKEKLEEVYGPRVVERGGLRVITTLDLEIQEKAQKILFLQLENLKKLKVGNGAVLVTNPQNGEILAMVGSKDYFNEKEEGNVNVTTSLRQPGSAIKVVNYAAALEQGLTAASVLFDTPVTYKIAGQPPYSPVNYDGKFHGPVTLRTALASSYNVPAVKVLALIGVKKMVEKGKMMGIENWEDESRFGLSLTLGGGEVTMLDLARVYGTLAAGGKRYDLTPILKITNWQRENLPLPPHKPPFQAVSSGVAFILSDILADNLARAPAFGPNSPLFLPGKTVAVKTGTSDNKRDNWTIGFTPDFLVAVWVGNNDNSPMDPKLTSGITGAAPIWREIMAFLLKDSLDKPFLPPPEVVAIPCFAKKKEYFLWGTLPKGGCRWPLSPSPSPS